MTLTENLGHGEFRHVSFPFRRRVLTEETKECGGGFETHRMSAVFTSGVKPSWSCSRALRRCVLMGFSFTELGAILFFPVSFYRFSRPHVVASFPAASTASGMPVSTPFLPTR